MTDEPKLSERIARTYKDWLEGRLAMVHIGTWADEVAALERELAEAKQQAQLAREAAIEEVVRLLKCESCEGTGKLSAPCTRCEEGEPQLDCTCGEFECPDPRCNAIRALSGTDHPQITVGSGAPAGAAPPSWQETHSEQEFVTADHIQTLIGATYRAMRDKVDELTDTYEGWIRPSDYLRALTELENADAARALAAHDARVRADERQKRDFEIANLKESITQLVDDQERIRREAVEPWRELLWLNHSRYTPYTHMPYGDDGEMQCCGIDFKRQSAEEIRGYLQKRRVAAEAECAEGSKS